MLELYAKGSEWRKWDLHLHSFYTHMNNNYKSDNKTEENFVDKIVGSGLYESLYRTLKKYAADWLDIMHATLYR